MQETTLVELIEAPAGNDTSNNRHPENLSDVRRKKYQFEFTEHTHAYDNLVYKYWENLSDEERTKVLESEEVPKEVIQLYYGQFILSDDDATFELLDELTSGQSDIGLKALYFYLFSKILLVSDGALSEVMGEYGINIFMSDISYALEYFTVNNEIMVSYGWAFGPDFYFEETGSTGFPYTFSEFKNKIKADLKNSGKYDELLSTFYEKIESIMKGMN